MRQFFGDFSLERKAFVFFCGTLLLTILGPFGTYNEMTIWERLVFWFVTMFGVGFFMHMCIVLCLEMKALEPLRYVGRVTAGAMLGALPGVAVVAFIDTVFRPPMPSPETMRLLWFQVFLMGTAIGLFEFRGYGEKREATNAPTAVPDAPPTIEARILDRIEPNLGSDLVSMSMQDHYVEVTTTKGRQLVLLRMTDAEAETDGIEGLRIHRSHWVALAHAEALSRSGPKAQVTLKDGRALPVSATYYDALDAAMKARR